MLGACTSASGSASNMPHIAHLAQLHQLVAAAHLITDDKGKGRNSSIVLLTGMQPNQPHFPISEVAVDWQEPVVLKCNAAARTHTPWLQSTTPGLHPIGMHQMVDNHLVSVPCNSDN